MMNSDELIWWLRLRGIPGVGPIRYRLLLKEFGSPEAVWELRVKDFPAVVTMDLGLPTS